MLIALNKITNDSISLIRVISAVIILSSCIKKKKLEYLRNNGFPILNCRCNSVKDNHRGLEFSRNTYTNISI